MALVASGLAGAQSRSGSRVTCNRSPSVTRLPSISSAPSSPAKQQLSQPSRIKSQAALLPRRESRVETPSASGELHPEVPAPVLLGVLGDDRTFEETVKPTIADAALDCEIELLSDDMSDDEKQAERERTEIKKQGDQIRTGAHPSAPFYGRRFNSDLYKRWKASVGIPQDTKVFICTGGYPDIRRALLERGWVENIWDTGGPFFDLKWSSCGSIEFSDLDASQFACHYEKISNLTTKLGLNEHLDDAMGAMDVDINTFYPRTFHLNDIGQYSVFADEYKLQRACGILKSWQQHADSRTADADTFPLDVVALSLAVVQRFTQDIDTDLVDDENAAEVVGFHVTEEEWEILKEVDVDKPSKPLAGLQSQKDAKAHYVKSRGATQVAKERQLAQLQKQLCERENKLYKQQEEKQRKESLKHRLRKKVLGVQAEERLKRPSQKASPVFGEAVIRPAASAAAGGVVSCTAAASVECHAEEDLSPTSSDSANKAATPSLQRESSSQHGNNVTDGMERDSDVKEHQCIAVPCKSQMLNDVRNTLEAVRQQSPQFAMNGARNMWIMKPAGRSRARGIFVSSDLQAMLHCAENRKETTTWICQKYIENPLLLNGRKHDIRQWVLVTCWNPLTIWYFGECYVRLAATNYDTDDIGNTMSHLTNNAVACHHAQFDADDEYWRCMWDEDTYAKFLKKTYRKDAWQHTVLPAMKRCVVSTLQSVQDSCASSRNSHSCFELLGFDFMVDDELKVWLLEVNLSPSMDYSTSITRRMVPEVLGDTIKVVLGEDDPGKFELIHTGSTIPECGAGGSGAFQALVVDGRGITPPSQPESKPLKSCSAQELSDKRSKELEAVKEKQRLQKEKEQLKKDKAAKLRLSLRTKLKKQAEALRAEKESEICCDAAVALEDIGS